MQGVRLIVQGIGISQCHHFDTESAFNGEIDAGIEIVAIGAEQDGEGTSWR